MMSVPSTRAHLAAACRRILHSSSTLPQRNNPNTRHISRHAPLQTAVVSPSKHNDPKASPFFSTNDDNNNASTKKSPHSKLLRVCSNRNLNRHFAAVEADILQLNWDKSMKALVDDWIVKGNKWKEFTELEGNIRLYVDKNLPFLVLNWKKGQDGNNKIREINSIGMQLSDCIRMNHFPYEQVVLAAARHAISGQILLDHAKKSGKGGKKLAEMEARRDILLEAGKMLKSMADFRMERGAVTVRRWTMHHESCSTCFKAIVSGWFLLWRRMRDVQHDGMDVSSVETDTMYSSAMEWISFCTNGQIIVEGSEEVKVGKALMGGIGQSDKTLLLGVAKGLELSKDEIHRMKSIQLQGIVDELL
jgi:hypothetical protein